MSPVRAAVVGCGHFGRYHAENYRALAGAELVKPMRLSRVRLKPALQNALTA